MDKENKAKILLAEDEEDARMIYIDILEGGDFSVDGAKNGEETLEYLEQNEYDLLLLDIIMPDLDGISVLSKIKEDPQKYGKPKVVMLTNIGGDVAIEKALRIGALGYMLKSETEPKELIIKVNEYLENNNEN
jgi:CheY-like chemotaxis protein